MVDSLNMLSSNLGYFCIKTNLTSEMKKTNVHTHNNKKVNKKIIELSMTENLVA